jgi:hypothetical protein
MPFLICAINAKLDDWDKRDASWMSRATRSTNFVACGDFKIDSDNMSQNRLRNGCSGMNVKVVLNELRSREFLQACLGMLNKVSLKF